MEGKATLKLRKPQTDNIQNLYHESYDVLYCEYSLKKYTDKKGKVRGDVCAGNIFVALPLLPSDDIMTWIFDVSRKYNGEITINEMHNESLDKIYFEEARPVNFRLHYEPGDNANLVLLLTINAQRMVIGQTEHINRWK